MSGVLGLTDSGDPLSLSPEQGTQMAIYILVCYTCLVGMANFQRHQL